MASFTGSSIKDVYKDLLHTSNSNTGIGSSIKQITCGDGDTSALYLSDRNLKVQPSTDSTTNTVIYDAGGNALLTVDSNNDLVKAGIGQHTVNTQYAHFGIGSADSVWAGAVANTHYAVPFNGYANQALVSMGTGTNPATSLTIATTGDDVTCCLWYVMDDITVERVIWWHGGDAASGDTTRVHLNSYTIATGVNSTSGDLSSGAVVADGDGVDIANAGYEQAYYQQLTVQSADVDAGKALLFMVRSDSVNSDYSINATIKYHLR